MSRKRTAIILSTVSAVGLLAILGKAAQVVGPSPIPSGDHTGGTNTPLPTFTPTFEGCAFMWAYHEAPELSTKLEQVVQASDPDAGVEASFFGEDCIYSDGHATFTAMETNFHVQLPVTDLSDERAFGDWMKQVIEVILALPDEEVLGRPGVVEFTFFKNDAERVNLRVALADYQYLSPGTTGADLFNRFYTPPAPPLTYPPPTPTPTP